MPQAERTIQAIGRIFNAQSVAVIGASGDPSKFGFMVLNTVISAGYEGRIFPVNPKGGVILGLPAYKSIQEVPDPLDLAVIVVPAHLVPGVLREVAGKKAFGAVILSAGFREAGRPDLEKEILSISQKTGLRLMGPNIQGINYLPNKLCPMFFPVIKKKGPLAIISQSGTITAALSEWAADEGLGISAAINLGNQVDLCESDYLDFFATDEHTSAVVMYIEGIKNGHRFLETLNRVVPRKPVVILKSGRTEAGQKSAASHTGSMAGSNKIFNSACRQVGAICVNDLETLYDYGKALATMSSPRGNRLLTISSSGGACTLAVDEADSLGLHIPELPDHFIDALKKLPLSPLATLSNPLDLASISADHFQQVALLADQYDIADVILLNYGDPVIGATEVTRYLASKITRSIAVSFLGGGEEEKQSRFKMQEHGIPVFPCPERAIRGIKAAILHSYQKGEGRLSPFVSDTSKKSLPKEPSGRMMIETEGINLLLQYNIPYPDCGLALTPEEAVNIAQNIGYPVVMKVVSPDILHKSDVGGVALGLTSPHDILKSFDTILSKVQSFKPNALIKGMLVCKEAPDGLDIIIGAKKDSVFGSTIMFGLGGIFTEVLHDVSFRIAPLSRKDADEMIKEIKGYALLKGFRGQTGYDTDRLIELLLTVSDMLKDYPDSTELDLNPVRLSEGGVMTLDVRIIRK